MGTMTTMLDRNAFDDRYHPPLHTRRAPFMDVFHAFQRIAAHNYRVNKLVPAYFAMYKKEKHGDHLPISHGFVCALETATKVGNVCGFVGFSRCREGQATAGR